MSRTRAGGPPPPSLLNFVLAALALPMLLLAVAFWLQGRIHAVGEQREEVRASLARRIDITLLLSSLRGAESAQRGYVLTGNRAFLDPYVPLRGQADRVRTRLERSDLLPGQRRSIERLGGVARAKFAEMDRTIALRRADPAQAVALVSSQRGRVAMAELEQLIGDAMTAEDQRLRRREADYATSVVSTRRLVLLAVIGGAALLLLLGLRLWHVRRLAWQREVEAFEAAERNRRTLASTSDAIVIVNPSGTIESINDATTALLGYREADVRRRDIRTIVDVAPGNGSFLDRLGLEEGDLRRKRVAGLYATGRDGRRSMVDVAFGLMPLPSGCHVVLSMRDASERQQLDRIKDDLISTISHELRTPLTSVVGSLGLLRSGVAGPLPEAAQRLIAISDNNARRLIRLINDLLDLDRLASGALDVQPVPIDLRDVVRLARDGGAGVAGDAGVRIDLDLPDAPIPVRGDKDRLVQVLLNLLANAVRVSEPGGEVVMRAWIGPSSEALVSVSDRGPGIPQELRPRLFGRFERAEGSSRTTGAGLGLAISRQIVDQHDGRIWFEDRGGGGTVFTLSLPLRRPLQPLVSPAEGERPHVLVIADGDGDELGRLVAGEGYEPTVVRGIDAARAALAERAAHAVLLSSGGFGGSTLEGVRLLREVEGPRVPLVVVADLEEGDADQRLALDIVDWLEKPIDVDRLNESLVTAVARLGVRRPVILHVEDDDDVLELTTQLLSPDATMLRASSVAEAEALLAERKPDIAILDLKLGDGSGLDLLPLLVDARGRAIPTIIFSAQDVTPAMSRKVDAILTKSRKSLPDLRATIRRLLRTRQQAETETVS